MSRKKTSQNMALFDYSTLQGLLNDGMAREVALYND